MLQPAPLNNFGLEQGRGQIVDPKASAQSWMQSRGQRWWLQHGLEMGFIQAGASLSFALQQHRAQLVLVKDKSGSRVHAGKCARRVLAST
jgi:hypothetical protein